MLPVFQTPGNRSLRRVLTLSLVGIFLLGVLISSLYFYLDSRDSLKDLRKRNLQAQASALTDAYARAPTPQLAVIPADWQKAYGDPNSGYAYSVYNAKGELIAASSREAPLPLIKSSNPDDPSGPVVFLGPKAVPALAAHLLNKNLFFVVSRAKGDEAAVAASLTEERPSPFLVLLPFALVAGIAIWAILTWTLKPIQLASRQAEAIGPANLSLRINIDSLPAEVRPLGVAFNGALDRLAVAYEIERRITANAAHELRTPLTILSLELQRARNSPEPIDWIAVEQDIARMQRIISQLLVLARKEARMLVPGDAAEANLSRAVRESAAALIPLVEQAGRKLEVRIEDNVTLSSGHADDLRDLANNLIENALLHGRGKISVMLNTMSIDGSPFARLRVSDEGQGISAGARKKMFERFHKGSESSAGAGLGLSIVMQVAANLGGLARFVDSRRTAVEVVLPQREESTARQSVAMTGSAI